MNWQKLLSDLALTTERPVNEGTLYFAMLIDLYQFTSNKELKAELELVFIKMLSDSR